MTQRQRKGSVFVLLALLAFDLLLAGCGAQFDVSQSSMSEAQRDSAIARSFIPGSMPVKRAYRPSPRVAFLTARLDSL